MSFQNFPGGAYPGAPYISSPPRFFNPAGAIEWTQEGKKEILFLVSFQMKLLFHVQLQGVWVFKNFLFQVELSSMHVL